MKPVTRRSPLQTLPIAIIAILFVVHKPLCADRFEQKYRIETIAGNGMRGDTPSARDARKVPVDLPFGVEYGPDRRLYITTVGSHRILRLDPSNGSVISVAGNGRKGYAGDGKLATKAMLNEPYEVRFDSQGNMLILEMKNHLLRRVDAKTGIISTMAGDGVAGNRGDGGPARKARFRYPHSLVIDKQDNIYIADLANHRVRRIDAKSKKIETVAGNGRRGRPKEGGLAKNQPLLTPQGIAIRKGTLWIASFQGHVVWRVKLKTGVVERMAGTGKRGYTGDGKDPRRATFDGPRGVTMSPAGILYVVEGENNIIRAFDTARNKIRTVAGAGPKRHLFVRDGVSALGAPMWQPHGVIVSLDGSLIISDTINHRVRKLVPIRRKP